MDLLRRWIFHFRYSLHRAIPWDTDITPPEVEEFIISHPPGRVLDLGCGTGTNIITLTRHGWQATGVDYAWSAIRIARWKLQQAGMAADLRVDSVTRLYGINGPFNLILDIGCFHNLSSDSRLIYLEHVVRLLDPMGTYLLYVHIKPKVLDRGPGVVEADLERITSRLRLISRQDGTDRGRRSSAWLTYSPAS